MQRLFTPSKPLKIEEKGTAKTFNYVNYNEEDIHFYNDKLPLGNGFNLHREVNKSIVSVRNPAGKILHTTTLTGPINQVVAYSSGLVVCLGKIKGSQGQAEKYVQSFKLEPFSAYYEISSSCIFFPLNENRYLRYSDAELQMELFDSNENALAKTKRFYLLPTSPICTAYMVGSNNILVLYQQPIISYYTIDGNTLTSRPTGDFSFPSLTLVESEKVEDKIYALYSGDENYLFRFFLSEVFTYLHLEYTHMDKAKRLLLFKFNLALANIYLPNVIWPMVTSYLKPLELMAKNSELFVWENSNKEKERKFDLLPVSVRTRSS